jgi:hypothetical protein
MLIIVLSLVIAGISVSIKRVLELEYEKIPDGWIIPTMMVMVGILLVIISKIGRIYTKIYPTTKRALKSKNRSKKSTKAI